MLFSITAEQLQKIQLEEERHITYTVKEMNALMTTCLLVLSLIPSLL